MALLGDDCECGSSVIALKPHPYTLAIGMTKFSPIYTPFPYGKVGEFPQSSPYKHAYWAVLPFDS